VRPAIGNHSFSGGRSPGHRGLVVAIGRDRSMCRRGRSMMPVSLGSQCYLRLSSTPNCIIPRHGRSDFPNHIAERLPQQGGQQVSAAHEIAILVHRPVAVCIIFAKPVTIFVAQNLLGTTGLNFGDPVSVLVPQNLAAFQRMVLPICPAGRTVRKR
jgi:hypothetical protein